MRACSRCGFESADHLAYCVQCGRRFAPSGGPEALALLAGGAGEPGSGALGRTEASWSSGSSAPAEAGASRDRPAGGLRQLLDSMRYVFTHVRSRLDADTRRRRLAEEREGAARLVSGALSELGQAILAEGVNSPELTGLLEAVGRAQAQRETAQAEIGSTEIFRASEEARLGTLEATLGAELDACERGVEEAERALRQIDDARRKLSPGPSPGGPGEARAGGAGSASGASANPPADTRRLRLDQQYDGTRERAAALRAAGLAARAKLDQATAARRQAMAALNASITGHARERTEAEHRIEELQNQIGRVGWQLRIPHPRLMARYQRIDRHQQTITDRDRQIATVAKLAGRYDRRKLGIGIGLLAGIVVVATLLLGVLIR